MKLSQFFLILNISFLFQLTTNAGVNDDDPLNQNQDTSESSSKKLKMQDSSAEKSLERPFESIQPDPLKFGEDSASQERGLSHKLLADPSTYNNLIAFSPAEVQEKERLLKDLDNLLESWARPRGSIAVEEGLRNAELALLQQSRAHLPQLDPDFLIFTNGNENYQTILDDPNVHLKKVKVFIENVIPNKANYHSILEAIAGNLRLRQEVKHLKLLGLNNSTLDLDALINLISYSDLNSLEIERLTLFELRFQNEFCTTRREEENEKCKVQLNKLFVKLKNMPSFQSLSIKSGLRTYLSQLEFDSLTIALNKWKNLKNLTLTGQSMLDKNSLEFSLILRAMTHLKTLNLGFNKLSFESSATILLALASLVEIESIDLSYNELSFAQQKKLRTLDFRFKNTNFLIFR